MPAPRWASGRRWEGASTWNLRGAGSGGAGAVPPRPCAPFPPDRAPGGRPARPVHHPAVPTEPADLPLARAVRSHEVQPGGPGPGVEGHVPVVHAVGDPSPVRRPRGHRRRVAVVAWCESVALTRANRRHPDRTGARARVAGSTVEDDLRAVWG